MNDDRLTALEERVAHQDKTIEELSELIAAQWREIDRLKRQLQMVDDQLASVEQLARSGRAEPPPPHY
ncbi:SlyX family protein [Pelagibacterium lacus]|uniref:Protein SlyX homolog n=1 Tax=Pelagibacterium lacus TaxID=2282655 RepID=A0A369W158_9HYPH|nr:SlyX family protein [Pelagibacterium lacus]RDE08416.1 SlyX protein [Pelagibacterium lacus]